MLDALDRAAPALQNALAKHPYITETKAIWEGLSSLLAAHAPSGGINFPGAILDQTKAIIHSLGLDDRYIGEIGATGNTAIWLGEEKETADIIILAHLDRPTYKVRSASEGILYPICATRFPTAGYRVGAKALRFEGGKMMVSATGTLVSERPDGKEVLRFETGSGELRWYDLVTMEVTPTLTDGMVKGTGLDNCVGMITALGAISALRSIEDAMKAQHKRCLFIFTDQEEGIPEAFFGHGAARLTGILNPPTYGCIIVDGQTVTGDGAVNMGLGGSHGTVSAWGRGAVVQPNMIRLAADLSEEVNAQRPNTVQMNTGYLSRSDDMILGRWTQILGMMGPPLAEPHTGEETSRLSDIQSSIWWLSYFITASLQISPEITEVYMPKN